MSTEQNDRTPLSAEELRDKLNRETGQLDWSELQRYFARGIVISISDERDLIEVAMKFTEDDRATIEDWLANGQLERANDNHARDWNKRRPVFWAIVVAPWVLVQEVRK